MKESERQLLSGNEAIALAARQAGVALGAGYPGTPSTEILERLAALGGYAQWSPNEKVALEVGLGAAYAGARALVTMKHVGLNVAADPLFTAAYTGVSGAMVVISADDPGLASSQNEQDNRHYAVAMGLPMLEPADSQEAYDFLALAIEISERWHIPVLLRVTTRVCHSKTVVRPRPIAPPAAAPNFQRDIKSRVMIPAYARLAHRRLRRKLAEMADWNEASGPSTVVNLPADLAGTPAGAKAASSGEAGARNRPALGFITSGISHMHAREAAPEAAVLKIGMTYPLPLAKIRAFAAAVERCLVIEEGDPWLVDAIRAAGVAVEGKAEMYRFGELNVGRVRRIIAGDLTPEPAAPPGKPPQLCQGCPHREVFGVLRKLDCIVAGDIGCYTLGVLPPFESIDTCVCMGASISVGLGLRRVLPEAQARRVVSVIGDSTFVHSGLTGLVEMVYNLPPTGHLLIILDNGTTAMTGLQEHPGTGRTLAHQPTDRLIFEDLARAMGLAEVHVVDPSRDLAGFEALVTRSLAGSAPALIIARRACILAAGKIREYQKAAEGDATHGE